MFKSEKQKNGINAIIAGLKKKKITTNKIKPQSKGFLTSIGNVRLFGLCSGQHIG